MDDAGILNSTIDRAIDNNDCYADMSVTTMENTLCSIVDGMMKRGIVASYEATMIKGFIHYMTNDKRKVINAKADSRRLVSSVKDATFKQVEKKWENYYNSDSM